MNTPLETAGNGQSAGGRFGKGNQFAAGRGGDRKVLALRRALLEAVTEDDITAVVRKLIEQAKAGCIHSAREVLDRCLGRSQGYLAVAAQVETEATDEVTLTHEERLAKLRVLLESIRTGQPVREEPVVGPGTHRVPLTPPAVPPPLPPAPVEVQEPPPEEPTLPEPDPPPPRQHRHNSFPDLFGERGWKRF